MATDPQFEQQMNQYKMIKVCSCVAVAYLQYEFLYYSVLYNLHCIALLYHFIARE